MNNFTFEKYAPSHEYALFNIRMHKIKTGMYRVCKPSQGKPLATLYTEGVPMETIARSLIIDYVNGAWTDDWGMSAQSAITQCVNDDLRALTRELEFFVEQYEPTRDEVLQYGIDETKKLFGKVEHVQL